MKKFNPKNQQEDSSSSENNIPPMVYHQHPSQNYYSFPPQNLMNPYQYPQISFFQNFLNGMMNNPNQQIFNSQQNQPIHLNSRYQNMIQSLFKVVQQQNNSLQNLTLKACQISNKAITSAEKLKNVQNQKNTLQNNYNGLVSEKKNKPQPQNYQKVKFSGQQINAQQLIQLLFSKKKYDYQLKLGEQISLPLYRQRNFNLKIKLFDHKGQEIKNKNKIPMSIGIYTCENPPKFLQKNTSGQKMLKGFTQQALINGQCIFEKIQIRQVTSHYREGWIYVVIIPCMTPLGAQQSQKFIDYKKIKPLVISNIVVKAKKPKKKNQESNTCNHDAKSNQKNIHEDDYEKSS